MGCAISLERPDFHLSEALSTELGLAAERLLGDERVRTDRALVDLVIDHVVELEHVLVAHRDLIVISLTGLAIIQSNLAIFRQACLAELFFDLIFSQAVQNRGRRLVTELLGREAKMGFQKLAQVHTGNDTKGRENDIDRSAVL